MHLLDGKKGILRPKKGLVFELRPQLAAFYRGPTPIDNSHTIEYEHEDEWKCYNDEESNAPRYA